MDVGTKKGLLAFLLAAAIAICAPLGAYAFAPWSQVGEYWVSADGNTPIEGAVEKGVTITKYQNRAGDINWKQVASDGISFVMVLLERGQDSDKYFGENVEGAVKEGLKVGVCYYGSAQNVAEAEKEARYVLGIIKDYKISYPVGYNIESSPLLAKRFTREQVTELVNAFCREIEEAGYPALVYGDYGWINRYMDAYKIPYDIWYSRPGMANAFANRTIWRCTDSGKVNGVRGSVCLEFSFEDYTGAFPETGWRRINGVDYYFVKHQMVKNRSLAIEGQQYYFNWKGVPSRR